ncbi:MAG: 50S ribosomal protein L17 [Tissierellia bacterium]|nr:50S ribosomal protein L17 [Bacillota bacterium]NLL23351.1 50S ribosomal protein L17 [Tissierellia bacterium]
MTRYRKLNRYTSHRIMMLRNMTTDLLRHETITTTEAKAKELKRSVDRMITLAKRGDLHARRQAAAYLTDKVVVQRLFDELGPRYAERNGGYSRIYKLGPRRGDATMMVKIELV